MTYKLTGMVACEDGCCVVGRDDELREELLGWDNYPSNHTRPMFEMYVEDDCEETDCSDDAASWNPFADHDFVCEAVYDTDRNIVFPALCDPTNQPCPFPKPPPWRPNRSDRRFALAA